MLYIVSEPEKVSKTFVHYFYNIAKTKLLQHLGENVSLPCTTSTNHVDSLFANPYIDIHDIKEEITI